VLRKTARKPRSGIVKHVNQHAVPASRTDFGTGRRRLRSERDGGEASRPGPLPRQVIHPAARRELDQHPRSSAAVERGRGSATGRARPSHVGRMTSPRVEAPHGVCLLNHRHPGATLYTLRREFTDKTPEGHILIVVLLRRGPSITSETNRSRKHVLKLSQPGFPQTLRELHDSPQEQIRPCEGRPGTPSGICNSARADPAIRTTGDDAHSTSPDV
jgi:hypothetical protein